MSRMYMQTDRGICKITRRTKHCAEVSTLNFEIEHSS